MKFVLVGSFSGSNLGDSLVLKSAVSYISSVFGSNVKIIVPTARPRFVRDFLADSKISTVNIRWRSGLGVRFFRPSVIREVRRADIVFTTAGILFGRNWYDPRRNFLSTLLPLLCVARRSGTRVFGLHTGVTPPSSRAERWILRKTLSMHDAIAARDDTSRNIVHSLTDTPAATYPDLAFLTLKRHISEQDVVVSQSSNGFAVNIASYLDRQNPSDEHGRIDRDAFIQKTAENLDCLAQETGLRVIFVATTTDDDQLHRQIQRFMKEKAECVKLYEMNIKKLLRVMGRVRFATMTRMHACILAISMQIPLVALSYNPKVDSLMYQMNLSKWVHPVHHAMSDRYLSSIKSMIKNEKNIKLKMKTSSQKVFNNVVESKNMLVKYCT